MQLPQDEVNGSRVLLRNSVVLALSLKFTCRSFSFEARLRQLSAVLWL